MTSDDRLLGDWDQLREPALTDALPELPPPDDDGGVTVAVLVGGAWGDLVSALAVCTATVAILAVLGYGAPVRSLPWAAAVAVVWWLVAAAVLVVVRRATPGMLMAGVVFSEQVPRRRLPWLLLAALVTWATLGLPSVFGGDRTLLGLASGVRLRAAGGRS